MDTIEFAVAKKNIFEYQDIGIRKVRGLPSQEGYFLDVTFKINGAPILNDLAHARIDEFIIIRHDCSLIFKRNSEKNSEISLGVQPEYGVWRPNTTIRFSTRINPSDIEYIGKWSEGKDLQIRWDFSGRAHMIPEHSQITRPLPFKITSESIPAKELPTLSPEQYDKLLASAVGLPTRLFYELPLDIPTVLQNTTFPESEIEELKNKLINTTNSIQNALEIHRKAKNTQEYKNAIREARSSIEDLRKWPYSNIGGKQFDQNIISAVAKKLYLDTGIIEGAGASEIAEEITKNVWTTIFDPIFDITSKASHVLSKTDKPYTSHPNRTDSEVVLAQTIATLGYLLRKLAEAI